MDILTTMITPYTEDSRVDIETAEKYVDFYYDGGLTGIFAVCQSSEIFFLSLEERKALNSAVYKRAKELEAKHGRPFTVVSSGHVSDTLEGQIEELNAIYETGTDALILITNRLDINNEGDDVWIANCEKLINALPKDAKLGLYECPYPYKRLVTPKILEWCLSTNRFYYMKDTCCDIATIKERCEILKGSHFKLLNANCQTLLQSVIDGADGYCGIMCNYHPKLYSIMLNSYESDPETAAAIQSVIGTFGFTEAGLPYPLSAKYSMTLSGIHTPLIARNRPGEGLSDYQKHCVAEMKKATDIMTKLLEKKGEN